MFTDFSLRLNYKYIEYILCHLLLIIFIYKYCNTLLYLYSTHKHIMHKYNSNIIHKYNSNIIHKYNSNIIHMVDSLSRTTNKKATVK